MMLQSESVREGVVKQWWKEKCQGLLLARLNQVKFIIVQYYKVHWLLEINVTLLQPTVNK